MTKASASALGASVVLRSGVAALSLWVSGLAAAAEPADREERSGPVNAEPVAADSPRASVARYLDLARAGSDAEAAQYLAVPAGRPDAERLARRLKAVLDRHLWVDLESLSPASEGSLDDGLPPDTEEIGTVPGAAGARDAVRLVRRDDGAGKRWVFSEPTARRIDGWYAGLEHRWLLERLPPPLLRPGPRDLLWWQWLAFPAVIALCWFAGFLLSRMSRRILTRLASRTASEWDDALVARASAPLTLAFTLGVAWLALPWLGLFPPARHFVHQVLRTGAYVTFFWFLLRTVDIARRVIAASPWARAHPASRSLLPIGARAGKVAILAVAVVALLSQLGYPVASLVAGLGIGGIAVALAAQKTVENVFGAFSIGLDQPFQEGDFVRVEDLVGTVEAVGLRSTRIRTLDRTLVSIPNGRLADMRLESFSARDRMRLACTIGVVYGTTAAQMREVLAGLERVLRAHPKIWPDAVVVRFKELGASSLDIEVMAWFQTPDWGEFQRIRQEVLLQFMEVVEGAGSSFAFPTRTVHLVPPSPRQRNGASRNAAVGGPRVGRGPTDTPDRS